MTKASRSPQEIIQTLRHLNNEIQRNAYKAEITPQENTALVMYYDAHNPPGLSHIKQRSQEDVVLMLKSCNTLIKEYYRTKARVMDMDWQIKECDGRRKLIEQELNQLDDSRQKTAKKFSIAEAAEEKESDLGNLQEIRDQAERNYNDGLGRHKSIVDTINGLTQLMLATAIGVNSIFNTARERIKETIAELRNGVDQDLWRDLEAWYLNHGALGGEPVQMPPLCLVYKYNDAKAGIIIDANRNLIYKASKHVANLLQYDMSDEVATVSFGKAPINITFNP